MPRQSKGPHLWFRPERVDKRTGKLIARGAWIIIDAGKHHATGCAQGEIGAAQGALATYIADKYRPPRKERDIERISVADVLSIYDDDRADSQANRRVFDGAMERLNDWWGSKMLAQVTGETCRAYVATRKTSGGARRDLEVLRAAINHHAKEGLHRGIVRVSLPDKGAPRDRWLTRSEAAKLIWHCYRAREAMTITRGENKGNVQLTKRRPLRHVARFILLGLYTGTRAAAIAAASPVRAEGRSWVDLKAGVFYRLQEGKKATNKRQPPVRLPPHLLSHLRRWARADPKFFVEWNGKPVKSVKTGFASAVEAVEIEHATPHTLRHTAATWLMQNGVEIWEAAGFLGMSEQTLRNVYGHHHPDFQTSASRGFRPKK